MNGMRGNEMLADDLNWQSGIVLSAPLRGRLEAQLDQLKEKLLRPIVEPISNTDLIKELSRAATEAAALAWFTVCPILVLPTLLEEKIRATLRKWEKQEQLRKPQVVGSLERR
jgi:hypothetical protein